MGRLDLFSRSEDDGVQQELARGGGEWEVIGKWEGERRVGCTVFPRPSEAASQIIARAKVLSMKHAGEKPGGRKRKRC